MAAMAQTEERPMSAGAAPRLPTLPVSDGRVVMEAFVEKVGTSGSTDRLPVVELRPFMNQEWRPSRSIPDYYDRTMNPMTTSNQRRDSGPIAGYPDAASLGLMHQKSSEFGSRNSLVNERREALRLRRGEGKPVDTSHDGTFVTTVDREKTTIEEMKATAFGTGGPCMQTASIVRSLSEGEMVRLREMCIQGRRVENLPPKLNMFYMSPWEYYRMHRPYQIPLTDRGGDPSQNAATIIDDLEMRYQALENVQIDDNIYDTFDRSNTLPSIQVTNAPTRRKRLRKRQPSATSCSAPGSGKNDSYRLGVANSLDVLRHFGRPARVETHLTMHLKHTLNQIRRSKDPQSSLQWVGPGLMQPQTLRGSKPLGLRTTGTPTYGESMIQAGIEANNKKAPTRNIRAALPSKSAPDVLSYPTTYVKNETYDHQPEQEGQEFSPRTPRSGQRVRSQEDFIHAEEFHAPKTPPSSAERMEIDEADAAVERLSRQSRRSKGRDNQPNTEDTMKSPRTKSRRSKGAKEDNATRTSSRQQSQAEGALSRASGRNSVAFKDKDGKNVEKNARKSRTPPSRDGATSKGMRTEADDQGEARSTSESRNTPVCVPQASDGSHPKDQIVDNQELKSDINEVADSVSDIEVTPDGSLIVDGNTVGAIAIGTSGNVMISGRSIGVLTVDPKGDIVIRTDKDFNTGAKRSDNIGASQDNNGDRLIESDSDVVTKPNQEIPVEASSTEQGDAGLVETPDLKDKEVVPVLDTEAEKSAAENGEIDVNSNQNTLPGEHNAATAVENTGHSLEKNTDTKNEAVNGHISDTNMERMDVCTVGENEIAVIESGPEGNILIDGKDFGIIKFGRKGEIKIGDNMVGVLSVTLDGNVAIKTSYDRGSSGSSREKQGSVKTSPGLTEQPLPGSRRSNRGSNTPGSTSISAQQELIGGENPRDVEAPVITNGTENDVAVQETEPHQDVTKDANNNDENSSVAQGQETPLEEPELRKPSDTQTPQGEGAQGQGSPLEEAEPRDPGGAQTSEGDGAPATTMPSTPAPTPPKTPGPHGVVPEEGREGEESIVGHPAGKDRKIQTKSAASKASSQGYRGDTVYLTSWDQKTETESVRPETVLTVREEGE